MHGGDEKCVQIFFGKLEKKIPDLGVDGKIQMDIEKLCGSCGLDSSTSGKEPMVGSCEHGNEPSGSIEVVYLLTI
jgi:hypothetical protein